MIVDGDSASYGTSTPGERPTLAKLRAIMDELSAAGIPHEVVVASYTWNLKGFRGVFDAFARERGIIQAPAGTKTDEMVLQLARKRRAQGWTVYLVSNDAYREYPVAKEFPRVGFVVTRDGLVLTSPEVRGIATGGPPPAEASPGTGPSPPSSGALGFGRDL